MKMNKTTERFLWITGAAIGLLVVGKMAYAEGAKSVPAVPPNPAPPAPPLTAPATAASVFTKGTKYTFSAAVPQGVQTDVDLSNALVSAGWSNVAIINFNGYGPVPTGFVAILPGYYAASGVWTGADATPVPPGVFALATP